MGTYLQWNSVITYPKGNEKEYVLNKVRSIQSTIYRKCDVRHRKSERYNRVYVLTEFHCMTSQAFWQRKAILQRQQPLSVIRFLRPKESIRWCPKRQFLSKLKIDDWPEFLLLLQLTFSNLYLDQQQYGRISQSRSLHISTKFSQFITAFWNSICTVFVFFIVFLILFIDVVKKKLLGY